MPSSPRSYDRSDLILAWLSRRKYLNAHQDLRTYHDAAYSAFSKAFGIDLDVPRDKGMERDEDGLHGLFLEFTRAYEETRSPFSNYLSATPRISGIYQKYREPLGTAIASVRNVHLMMMVELVELIWGGDSPHRVNRESLDACGYPSQSAPTAADYW